jgi:glycosyltransferase involved in cell wall biosynthesis
MRIAFYAPLKPPDHPVASGDRTMARLLMEALARAGHEVQLISHLRSYDGAGDERRQARIAALGARMAQRLVRRFAAGGAPPQLWFTYHLYHKAPDWLGPAVSRTLGLPYVAAEASLAGKRSDGPWRQGHAAVLAALAGADAVIGLNGADRPGVLPALAAPERWHALPPFVDTAPFAAGASRRAEARAHLAAQHGLDPAMPWLIAVAMMRPGDKLLSYRLLAAALARLQAPPWQLLIVGNGPAQEEIRGEFAASSDRIRLLGRLEGGRLASALAAADLCVWPAINEAYGMALLEAQAAGTPVLAGASGGVPEIVADGLTGRLTPPGDLDAFTRALAELIAAPALCRSLGAAAQRRAAERHDVAAAAHRLDAILRGVRAAPSAREPSRR